MCFDHWYKQIHGELVRIDTRLVNGEWEDIPTEEMLAYCTEFWVDVAHGANYAIQERYYFPDLESAVKFYLDGWKERQYLDEDGKEVGLDHSALYSRGRFIHGEPVV